MSYYLAHREASVAFHDVPCQQPRRLSISQFCPKENSFINSFICLFPLFPLPPPPLQIMFFFLFGLLLLLLLVWVPAASTLRCLPCGPPNFSCWPVIPGNILFLALNSCLSKFQREVSHSPDYQSSVMDQTDAMFGSKVGRSGFPIYGLQRNYGFFWSRTVVV